MNPDEAIQLLTHPDFNTSGRKVWVDLGCGSGTFTLALASLLPQGSLIHAMDRNSSGLSKLPDQQGPTSIKKLKGDFMKDQWPSTLDGILMANALHFVKDKESFLRGSRTHLNLNGCFLLIEYDLEKANPWVPYPLNFVAMEKVFLDAGFTSVNKMNERLSAYNKAMMYSAVIFV